MGSGGYCADDLEEGKRKEVPRHMVVSPVMKERGASVYSPFFILSLSLSLFCSLSLSSFSPALAMSWFDFVE